MRNNWWVFDIFAATFFIMISAIGFLFVGYSFFVIPPTYKSVSFFTFGGLLVYIMGLSFEHLLELGYE